MSRVTILKEKLKDIKARPGDLFEKAGDIYLLATIGGGVYSLSSLDGTSFWGAAGTLEKINKRIKADNLKLVTEEVVITPQK